MGNGRGFGAVLILMEIEVFRRVTGGLGRGKPGVDERWAPGLS
jgi:hypothetical protein